MIYRAGTATQLGLGTDDTAPVEFTAQGKASSTSLYDAFMDFEFENVYSNGVRMIGNNEGPRGVKFEGDQGWLFIHVHGGKLESEPASLLEEKIGELISAMPFVSDTFFISVEEQDRVSR